MFLINLKYFFLYHWFTVFKYIKYNSGVDTAAGLDDHQLVGQVDEELALGLGTSKTSLCTATTFSSILDLQTFAGSLTFFLLNLTVTLRTKLFTSGWTSVIIAYLCESFTLPGKVTKTTSPTARLSFTCFHFLAGKSVGRTVFTQRSHHSFSIAETKATRWQNLTDSEYSMDSGLATKLEPVCHREPGPRSRSWAPGKTDSWSQLYNFWNNRF